MSRAGATSGTAGNPTVAHWIDGEPLDDSVASIARIEDRWRRYVVEGVPIATGVIAVGDSWACSNPSVGRGASIALMHVVDLRDLLRHQSLDDPLAFASAWDEVTQDSVWPWFSETLWGDRHRLGEIDAEINGERYDPGDERYDLMNALGMATMFDPDLLRLTIDNALMNIPTDVMLKGEGVADKALSLGAGWRDAPKLGPTRADLLKVVNG